MTPAFKVSKKVILWIFYIVIAQAAYTQIPTQLKFKQYGIEEGLSQVTAKYLLEDRNGYLWIGTQDGLNRFDGYSFKIFRNDPEKPNSISSSFITALTQINDGQLLIGTDNGLNIFNPKNESFTVLRNQKETPSSISNDNITSILQDSKGRLWVGTENGLNLVNLKSKEVRRYFSDPAIEKSLSDDRIISLFEDNNRNLWIGTKNGLNLFNEDTQNFTSFFSETNTSTLSSNEIWNIYQDSKGQIWVGTTNGLNQFNKNGQCKRFLFDPNNPNSLSDNHVLSLFEDSNSNFWITTGNGGLNLWLPESNSFRRYQHNPDDPTSISSNTVWDIIEDRNGNLWLGLSSKGINFHDPRTQAFEHIKYMPKQNISVLDNAVRSIVKDQKNRLWIGSFTGLSVIDKKNNTTEYFQHKPNNPNSLKSNYVVGLLADLQDNIWIGTSKGLNFYDAGKNQLSEFTINNKTPFSNISIGPMLQDHQNNVWIGTGDQGLFRIDLAKRSVYQFSEKENFYAPAVNSITQDSQNRIWAGTSEGLYLYNQSNNTFISYTYDINDKTSISNRSVTCVVEDSKQNIWAGTNAGFSLFNPEQNNFRSFRVKDGLSNDVIYGALIDEQDNLWLSTNLGINKFDTKTETFVSYDQEDGLQGDEFNSRAYYKDDQGYFYFGGVNGLSIFHPNSIKENTTPPPVVLSKFLLFNQPVEINDSSVLNSSIDVLEEIILNYDQDMFAFEFSALNYAQSEKNQFAYKLEPFNRDWIYTDASDRKAVFTRVPPGSYQFRVKASNDDGYWNEAGKTISVKILPPWWMTWWAITLYVLVSILTTGLIVRFQWRRIQLKNKLKKEQEEAEQFKTLDKMKTQFFSNITHEFRTPLTLILGPSEQILKQPKLDESYTRGQVELIKRNSQKFLKLINQLLDLSKLEGSQMALEEYQGDLNEFVQNIVQNFQSGANQKYIQLNLTSNLQIKDYQFDRDKLEKIIYNLLSNALKFTPQNGSINVGVSNKGGEQNGITLIVEDSGIGIPEDKLPHIFDRFYQVEGSSTREYEGTGIGLALTKELIELQGGSIEVTSQLEKGTKFIIHLPLKEITKENEITTTVNDYEFTESFEIENNISQEESVDLSDEKPIVLIIEDNNDLRSFIQSVLNESFQTITAKDGAMGIESALKYIPDLIISDVMMPIKDGFEVTKTLKQNPVSSHIPIILLTAKSNLKSRVEGLKQGADLYLPKPFSVEELTLVANRQIETRKALQEKFIESERENNVESTYNELDKAFIDKLHAFIESNLSNEAMTVDELVSEAAMSHSQLYRKIKALTDLSIASFIRNYRLTRAMEILQTGENNVSEVANMTGFGDRKYFHKVFTDKFNVPPSQILKN